MIGEVILKNKLFSGESINIEYKVDMPKNSEKIEKHPHDLIRISEISIQMIVSDSHRVSNNCC